MIGLINKIKYSTSNQILTEKGYLYSKSPFLFKNAFSSKFSEFQNDQYDAKDCIHILLEGITNENNRNKIIIPQRIQVLK